jgi:hypothetical protein
VSSRRFADDELDGLLDEWATGVRLTARDAEAVRAAVVAERPAGLDAGWWSELMAQVSAAVIQAAALPDSARLALGRPTWSAGLPISA